MDCRCKRFQFPSHKYGIVSKIKRKLCISLAPLREPRKNSHIHIICVSIIQTTEKLCGKLLLTQRYNSYMCI